MAEPLDPDVIAFFGCPAHTPARESAPPPGDPCPNCGAVYDARGSVLTIPTSPEYAAATGIVAIRTGVHAGDDGLVCGLCGCLSPRNRAKVGAGTRPRPRRATRAEELAARRRDRMRLTKSERAEVRADHGPIGRAWLAKLDALEAGDDATAAAIDELLATAATIGRRQFVRRLRAIQRGKSCPGRRSPTTSGSGTSRPTAPARPVRRSAGPATRASTASGTTTPTSPSS